MSLKPHDQRSWFQRIEDQVNALEAEVSALKKPSGGISKETVEQVLGGPIPKDETEAATLHELSRALRESPHPTPEPLFEGTKSEYWVSTLAHSQALAKLARVTEERDDQDRRITQLEMTKSDLIRRNNELANTLKSERKARQEWDAANPPSPLTPEGETETFTEVPMTPEEFVAEHQRLYPGMWEFRPPKEDPRSALYREMLSYLDRRTLLLLAAFRTQYGNAWSYDKAESRLLDLIQRAEKAMEGESHE